MILFCNLRMDSPKSSILIEWCTILSRIASAIVFSPITSCQSHTGTWEVMMVARRPCRSSIMSISEDRAAASKGCMPKSSRMRRSVRSILFSSVRIVPFAFAAFSWPIRRAVLAYSTRIPSMLYSKILVEI